MSTRGTQQNQGKQRATKSCISISMVLSATTKEGHATAVISYLGALEDRQGLRSSLVPRRGWLGGPLIHMVELYQDRHPRVEPEQGLLQKATGGKATCETTLWVPAFAPRYCCTERLGMCTWRFVGDSTAFPCLHYTPPLSASTA